MPTHLNVTLLNDNAIACIGLLLLSLLRVTAARWVI